MMPGLVTQHVDLTGDEQHGFGDATKHDRDPAEEVVVRDVLGKNVAVQPRYAPLRVVEQVRGALLNISTPTGHS